MIFVILLNLFAAVLNFFVAITQNSILYLFFAGASAVVTGLLVYYYLRRGK